MRESRGSLLFVRVLAVLTTLVALLFVVAAAAGAKPNSTAGNNGNAKVEAKPNPAGNNGTVKIDGVPFDQHPNNEPHVGCTFEVDFYGFDKGDLTAVVSFDAQSPTGKENLKTDWVFIGEDVASGGTDLDAELKVNLSEALDEYTPHPKQGFHVKLTVNAQGSQGADVKHKVFWVDSCAPPTTTTTSPPSTTTTTTTTSPTTTTTTTICVPSDEIECP